MLLTQSTIFALRRLLGDQRHLLGLVVLLAVAISLAASLGGLGWLGRRRGGDPLRLALERTLRAIARHGMAPQAGCAAWAAATACASSSALASGTFACTSPVAGLKTSAKRPDVPLTWAPLM